MKVTMANIPTLEDFPSDRPNCGNCTRKGGACPRSMNNKNQHNGLLYSFNKEVKGIIYCCPNYTGPFELNKIEE